MTTETSKNYPDIEMTADCLDNEDFKQEKIILKESTDNYFNYNKSGDDDNENYKNNLNLDNYKNYIVNEESKEIIENRNLGNLQFNLLNSNKNEINRDNLLRNCDINKNIKDDEEKKILGEKEETNILRISEKQELNQFKNRNIPYGQNKANEEINLNTSIEIKGNNIKNKNPYSNMNNTNNNSFSRIHSSIGNEATKNSKGHIAGEIDTNNKDDSCKANIINNHDNNQSFHFEKCENEKQLPEEKLICNKNDITEYYQNSIELHKIKNKGLAKEKKKKNKGKNKFLSLFKRKVGSDSNFHENKSYTKEKNKSKSFNRDYSNLSRKSYINNLTENEILEKKTSLSNNNTKNNSNSEFDNNNEKEHIYVKKENDGAHKESGEYKREHRISSLKTDDHIILELQEEHNEDVRYNKNDDIISSRDKESEQKREKKLYSFEKIKSFVSSNTYLKDKKSLIIEKKSKISNEVKVYCSNYNIFISFILYLLCFSFILASVIYDSWKIHKIVLRSENNKKSVIIHIGATNIRRIQKISKKGGDMFLSIDKEQTLESLMNTTFCESVKKNDLEKFLSDLAKENKLISNKDNNEFEEILKDEVLFSSLKNPDDVGLLKDKKLILARKYIFGPTIYNLECKFLQKLRKAGLYHMFYLYAILSLLFISIVILFYILIKYKNIQNILSLKYISFVLANIALIILIFSIFSINREYNIPLCVQNDGSSDICKDGKSIYLVRLTIVLIVLSNLFFCKFLNRSVAKKDSIEESIQS